MLCLSVDALRAAGFCALEGCRTLEHEVGTQILGTDLIVSSQGLRGTALKDMRKDRSGYLWYTESKDGGKSWSNTVKTDIPNPGNKPRLIKCGDKIALINTPNSVAGMSARYPLSLWISDDDMRTWKYKVNLTDFPGSYCYADGFYENGHIIFSIEHNRHSILFFDVELVE